LFGLFFEPDGGDMFLSNVDRLSMDYMASYFRKALQVLFMQPLPNPPRPFFWIGYGFLPYSLIQLKKCI
jgi:hypothetical protein